MASARIGSRCQASEARRLPLTIHSAGVCTLTKRIRCSSRRSADRIDAHVDYDAPINLVPVLQQRDKGRLSVWLPQRDDLLRTIATGTRLDQSPRVRCLCVSDDRHLPRVCQRIVQRRSAFRDRRWCRRTPLARESARSSPRPARVRPCTSAGRRWPGTDPAARLLCSLRGWYSMSKPKPADCINQLAVSPWMVPRSDAAGRRFAFLTHRASIRFDFSRILCYYGFRAPHRSSHPQTHPGELTVIQRSSAI